MSTAGTLEHRSPLRFLRGARSPRVFWGVVVILAVVPLAMLYQRVFAVGVSTFVHWLLAIGCVLIAVAVFGFRRLPGWLNWLGFLFLATEGAIFFLQGLADLLRDDALASFAYQGLGQHAEAWMIWLFVLLWCGTLLLRDSWGWTRGFGFVAIVGYFAAELVRVSLVLIGVPPLDALKLSLLLPFTWLLLESIKQDRHPAASSG